MTTIQVYERERRMYNRSLCHSRTAHLLWGALLYWPLAAETIEVHEMSPKGIQNDSSRGMDAFTQSFVGVLATQAAHWVRIHTMPLSFASATCRNACAVVTCISPHEESSKR